MIQMKKKKRNMEEIKQMNIKHTEKNNKKMFFYSNNEKEKMYNNNNKDTSDKEKETISETKQFRVENTHNMKNEYNNNEIQDTRKGTVKKNSENRTYLQNEEIYFEVENNKKIKHMFEQAVILGADIGNEEKDEKEKEGYKGKSISEEQANISTNIQETQQIIEHIETDRVTINIINNLKEENNNENDKSGVTNETIQINQNSNDATVALNFIKREKNLEENNDDGNDLNENVDNANDCFAEIVEESSNMSIRNNEVEINYTSNAGTVGNETNMSNANTQGNTDHRRGRTNEYSDFNMSEDNVGSLQREDSDDEMGIYIKPCFISELLGYKISIDYEEYPSNKLCKSFFFIFFLILFFIIEFFLVYKGLVKIEFNKKLILVENKFNNIFITNFLYLSNDNALQKHRVTSETIRKEIINGNYTLNNKLCMVLKQFSIPCFASIELYHTNGENISMIIENTINKLKQVEEKNIFLYKLKEKEFYVCNDISKKHLSSGDEEIFIFIDTSKNIKVTKFFFGLTLFFIFARMILIMSRIMYELYIILFYRQYKLTLQSKKRYLGKYLWTICTISIIDIIFSDECVLCWLNGITPAFIYYFQYTIWTVSILCCLIFFFYKVCKRYARNINSITNLNDTRNCSRVVIFLDRIANILQHIYNSLFNVNIIFSVVYLILNIRKAVTFEMSFTIIILIVDIFVDSYVRQILLVRARSIHIVEQAPQKKFSVMEYKKKNAEILEFIKINEHNYQKLSVFKDVLDNLENGNITATKQEGDDINNGIVNNELDNLNIENAETMNKKFNLSNLFNKKYFNKKSIAKSLKRVDTQISNTNYNAPMEYCEICDEHYKNIILYPCMHGGFCEACIRSMLSNYIEIKNVLPQCPLCRENLQYVYKIIDIHGDENKQKIKAYKLLTIKTV